MGLSSTSLLLSVAVVGVLLSAASGLMEASELLRSAADWGFSPRDCPHFRHSLKQHCLQQFPFGTIPEADLNRFLLGDATTYDGFGVDLVQRLVLAPDMDRYCLALTVAFLMPVGDVLRDPDAFFEGLFRVAASFRAASLRYAPYLQRLLDRCDPLQLLVQGQTLSRTLARFRLLYRDPTDSSMAALFARLQQRVRLADLEWCVTEAAAQLPDPIAWARLFYGAVRVLLEARCLSTANVPDPHLDAFLVECALRTWTRAELIDALRTRSLPAVCGTVGDLWALVPSGRLLRSAQAADPDHELCTFLRPLADATCFVRILLHQDRLRQRRSNPDPDWAPFAGRLIVALLDNGAVVDVDSRHDALRILTLVVARGLSMTDRSDDIAQGVEAAAVDVDDLDDDDDRTLVRIYHIRGQIRRKAVCTQLDRLLMLAWPVAGGHARFLDVVVRNDWSMAAGLMASLTGDDVPGDVFLDGSVPLLRAMLPIWTSSVASLGAEHPLRMPLMKLTSRRPVVDHDEYDDLVFAFAVRFDPEAWRTSSSSSSAAEAQVVDPSSETVTRFLEEDDQYLTESRKEILSKIHLEKRPVIVVRPDTRLPRPWSDTISCNVAIRILDQV